MSIHVLLHLSTDLYRFQVAVAENELLSVSNKQNNPISVPSLLLPFGTLLPMKKNFDFDFYCTIHAEC